MLRSAFAATLALVALASTVDHAEARTKKRPLPAICDNVDVMRPCPASSAADRSPQRRHGALKRGGRGGAVAVPRPRPWGSHAGLVAPLAAKVAQIEGACGSRLISAVRHTLVAGTGRVSLHWTGHAADLSGNPACIYRQLSGWAGGYSVDYAAVGHVHISWDPDRRREWGVRFAHRGRGHRHRHSRRHHFARADR